MEWKQGHGDNPKRPRQILLSLLKELWAVTWISPSEYNLEFSSTYNRILKSNEYRRNSCIYSVTKRSYLVLVSRLSPW
jgi:hypothetical protein